MTKRKNKIISTTILVAFFLFGNIINAQNKDQTSDKIALLDFDKVKVHLSLKKEQGKKIEPMIAEIKKIIKEDEEKIAEMRARFRSGDKPGLFEKLKMRGQRNDRIDQIESLVDNIKDELTSEQIKIFSDIDVPKLPELSPKSFENN